MLIHKNLIFIKSDVITFAHVEMWNCGKLKCIKSKKTIAKYTLTCYYRGRYWKGNGKLTI